MAIWLDEKYSRYLPLEGVEYKSPSGRYFCNFRCPICGDSKESKSKKRGWLQRYKGDLVFVCYNCNTYKKFSSFLKQYFPDIYKDYLRELLTNGSLSLSTISKTIEFKKEDDIFASKINKLDLQLITELPSDHFAIKYLITRKIPAKAWSDIYYSDNFSKWAHEKQPDNFNGEFSHDERIILPLRDFDGNIFGVSARSLFNIKPKYLTLKFDEHKEKIFGLEKVDITKDIYVFEGPIDSMYIENSIAMVGATSGLEKLFNILPKEKLIIVADNERRNEFTLKYMKKAIDLGLRIVIWPHDFKFKDINEAFSKGIIITEEYIKNNIYSGLKADTLLKLFSKK